MWKKVLLILLALGGTMVVPLLWPAVLQEPFALYALGLVAGTVWGDVAARHRMHQKQQSDLADLDWLVPGDGDVVVRVSAELNRLHAELDAKEGA